MQDARCSAGVPPAFFFPQKLDHPEFQPWCANWWLKTGNANLPIGDFNNAIQENGVPGSPMQATHGPYNQ